MRAHHASRRDRQSKSVATNVSLDAGLVAEARELGINISRASAAGLEKAVAEARSERWLRDNKTSLDAWNAHVEAHGLPLGGLRRF